MLADRVKESAMKKEVSGVQSKFGKVSRSGERAAVVRAYL